MSCVDSRVGERLTEFVCDTLGAAERAKFEAHVSVCAWCRSEAQSLGRARDMTRSELHGALATRPSARIRAEVLRVAVEQAVVMAQGNKAGQGWLSWLGRPWFFPVLVTVGVFGVFFISRKTLTDPEILLPREKIADEAAPAQSEAPRAVAPAAPAPRAPGAAGIQERTEGEVASTASDLKAPNRRNTNRGGGDKGRAREVETDRLSGLAGNADDAVGLGRVGATAGGGVARQFAQPPPAMAPAEAKKSAKAARDENAENRAEGAQQSVDRGEAAGSAPAKAIRRPTESGGPEVVLSQQANHAFELQRWAEALQAYTTLLQLFPKHPEAEIWKKRVLLCQQAKKAADAKAKKK